jgi:tetratricopeptide (TPR) repeat protein
MYEPIFTADVVIADLSTANVTACYELGVRHVLRPHITIIIAEDQFVYPFDVNSSAILRYKHYGEDIEFTEARRFGALLKEAIQERLNNPRTDSPVYTYLTGLQPPTFPGAKARAEAALAGTSLAVQLSQDPTLSVLMEQAQAAQRRGEFVVAKSLLSAIREMMRPKGPDDPRHEEPYIIQQLALVTYMSQLPTPQQALEEARALLATLSPATSNDTETLGLWGTVHKRLWDVTQDMTHLDEAMRSYERGFYLRNDYYNGINLAFLLNVRTANALSRAEAIADFVRAERVRREVLSICDAVLQDADLPAANQYWVLATMAEAYLGTGAVASAEQKLQEAFTVAPAQWMQDSTQEQMAKLRQLLADSPLRFIISDAS